MRNKVSDLQSKLSHAGKSRLSLAGLDRKFGALYDKIYREDVIWEAWRFVRDRLRIFLKRKYSDQSRGTRRAHNGLAARLGIYQFG